MRRLLRSKFIRIIFVIVLAIGLFILQDYIDAQISDIEARTTIYIVNKEMFSKQEITESDVNSIDVLITQVPSYAIKSKEEIIGKYIIDDLTKGEYILSNNISERKNFESLTIPKGYKMISIPLDIDHAAGWKFEKKQIVELIYTPFDLSSSVVSANNISFGSSRIISDVEVVDIFNESLISVDDMNFSGVPKYVVLLLKENEAEFIAYAKPRGSFELLIVNNE